MGLDARMSHSFDRRDFLRAAAALAGNGLLGCGSDAQQWLADAAGAGGGGAGGMGSTASGGTDGAGGAGGAGGSGGSVPDELPPGVSTQFPSSLLKASADDMELPLNLIAGKIPGDMHGHMFIASPIPRGGGLHVFNGEAKIIRLDFGNATIGLKSKMLKTPCYYADKAVEGTSRAFQNAGMARFNFSLGF